MDKTATYAIKVSSELVEAKISSVKYIADALFSATGKSGGASEMITREMAIHLNHELSEISNLVASISDIASECHPRG